MALTILRTKGENNNFRNLAVQTMFGKINEMDKLIAKIYIVDDELKQLSSPKMYEITMSEEEFHTNLRIEAVKVNQLITSHSTNPEWNPKDYTKNLNDES